MTTTRKVVVTALEVLRATALLVLVVQLALLADHHLVPAWERASDHQHSLAVLVAATCWLQLLVLRSLLRHARQVWAVAPGTPVDHSPAPDAWPCHERDTGPVDRAVAARHEACHAVVAVTMGLRLASASIELDQDSAGRVVVADGAPMAEHELCWATLCTQLAPSTDPALARRPHSLDCASDFQSASVQLNALVMLGQRPAGHRGGMDAPALVIGARDRASEILTDLGAATESIEAELLEHGELDGERVREIVQSAPTAAR